MSTGPSIADRLRRRVLLLSPDAGLASRLQAALPEGWELHALRDPEAMGPWHEVLLYRFMVLDLDGAGAYDPLTVVETLRLEYQINLPVFCVGGTPELRSEVLAARADRCFDEADFLALLPRLCGQFA